MRRRRSGRKEINDRISHARRLRRHLPSASFSLLHFIESNILCEGNWRWIIFLSMKSILEKTLPFAVAPSYLGNFANARREKIHVSASVLTSGPVSVRDLFSQEFRMQKSSCAARHFWQLKYKNGAEGIHGEQLVKRMLWSNKICSSHVAKTSVNLHRRLYFDDVRSGWQDGAERQSKFSLVDDANSHLQIVYLWPRVFITSWISHAHRVKLFLRSFQSATSIRYLNFKLLKMFLFPFRGDEEFSQQPRYTIISARWWKEY